MGSFRPSTSFLPGGSLAWMSGTWGGARRACAAPTVSRGYAAGEGEDDVPLTISR